MLRWPTWISAVFLGFASAGIGSSIAWSGLNGSSGTAAFVTKVDFNRTFDDAAAGRRDLHLSVPTDLAGRAYTSRAEFDRAFTDAAAGRREFTPSVREKLRDSGWNSIKASGDKARLPGDGARLDGRDRGDGPATENGSDSAPPAQCEPVAAPYVDPALGRIVGRCMV